MGAGPDHYENWISNRLQLDAAVLKEGTSVANPDRDGTAATSDNKSVGGKPIPGFLIPGAIENGATPCPAPDHCPADTAPEPHVITGHTASDVPLSASGPGVAIHRAREHRLFLKMLRASPVVPARRSERVDGRK